MSDVADELESFSFGTSFNKKKSTEADEYDFDDDFDME